MRLAYLILAGILAAIPTIATAAWNGPGWYVTYSDVGGDYAIYSGPYSDQSQCNADAGRFDSIVHSVGSGGECEYLQKELPSLSDAEIRDLGAEPVTSGDSMQAASSSSAVNCRWTDEHMCLDLKSIRPEDENAHFTAHFTVYDCTTAGVGPPQGKCDPIFFEVNCITGLAYGGETADDLKKMETEWPPNSPMMKKLCPYYDAASGKQQRCLGGRPRLTHEDQLKACNELIEAASDPKEKAKYYSWRGSYFYSDVKQYPEAVRDYSKAIALDPKADYYDGRSNAYRADKKFDLAMSDLNTAIKLEPGKAIWIGIRGIYNASAKHYAAALADYQKSIAMDPKNSTIREQRVELLLKLKRYADARSEAEQLIAVAPTYAQGYYFRSVAERAQGEASPADADLAKARQLMPDVERVYSKAVEPDTPTPKLTASKH